MALGVRNSQKGRWGRARLLIVVPLTVAIVAGASGLAYASTPKPQLKPPAIVSKGQLRFCSDISSPPLEFYTSTQTPAGSDVAIGNAIAKSLGLKPVWEQTAFAGIVPALLAHHCDAILSQLYIKPARQKVVNFVPYMYSSESIVVTTANPKNITGLDSSLCGLNVSTVTGTTAQSNLEALSTTCTDDISALQNLALGRSDAYATTSETAAYYMGKQPNTYKFAGDPFGQILTGIAYNKGNPKLKAALLIAFAKLQASGQYNKIMTKWGLQRDEL
jgi:polar amino acid transport system substrate-binding protein